MSFFCTCSFEGYISFNTLFCKLKWEKSMNLIFLLENGGKNAIGLKSHRSHSTNHHKTIFYRIPNLFVKDHFTFLECSVVNVILRDLVNLCIRIIMMTTFAWISDFKKSLFLWRMQNRQENILETTWDYVEIEWHLPHVVMRYKILIYRFLCPHSSIRYVKINKPSSNAWKSISNCFHIFIFSMISCSSWKECGGKVHRKKVFDIVIENGMDIFLNECISLIDCESNGNEIASKLVTPVAIRLFVVVRVVALLK